MQRLKWSPGKIYLCDPSKPLSIKFTMEGAVFRSGKR